MIYISVEVSVLEMLLDTHDSPEDLLIQLEEMLQGNEETYDEVKQFIIDHYLT